MGRFQDLLAQEPVLGFGVFHGYQGAEQRRMCSELWDPARPYKTNQWAHLAESVWLGCEDGRIWREKAGGEANGAKEERNLGTFTSPPPPRLFQGQASSPQRILRVAKPLATARSWNPSRTMSPTSTHPVVLGAPPAGVRVTMKSPVCPRPQRGLGFYGLAPPFRGIGWPSHLVRCP